MAPRLIENLDELTAPLVQVFDGTVVLEDAVSVYGSFIMDYTGTEGAKAWPSETALLAEKSGNPVVQLGRDFAPDSQGYSVYLRDESAAPRREVIRAPYLDQAGLEAISGSFTLVGETATLWNLEVDAQQAQIEEQATPSPRMARAAQANSGQDGGQDSPASASLYAVRAAGDLIYWNPGGAIEPPNGGTSYPAGLDEGRDGLSPMAPLKTLAAAISAAQRNSTNLIVCMQTIELNTETAAEVLGENYLPFDTASQTIQMNGTLIAGQAPVVMNWDNGLPIINIDDGYNLSLQNIVLQGYTSQTTNRGRRPAVTAAARPW